MGCGWLGLPLAEFLHQKGYTVKGSTTSISKLELLKSKHIAPYLISLHANGVEGDMNAFLAQSELVICAIPPGLRKNSKESFVAKFKNLLSFIAASSVTKVLFISSTSVYADSNEVVTEDTQPSPITESGKQLVRCESLLREQSKLQTTIVRFGGLIGPDRHPIRMLAGKQQLENPEAPINLIHQEDCIEIIYKIIKTESWNTVFNAVAPYHPSRKDYYTAKAIALNLDPPGFAEKGPSFGKTVSSDKLIAVLNHAFKKLN